uniref:protein jagged-1a-like isoform X1 n=1 Tax=Styela clava TaxID=7725 RepID=UPI00193A5D33|nr:protein jagged-1a-like isoform X1 [Styela clava]
MTMDKYFCILVLLPLAVGENGLSGSGASCSGGECAADNEICYSSNDDTLNCYCPYGFMGDNCEEPDTSLIDEKCEIPDKPENTCDDSDIPDECGSGCGEFGICCSSGCGRKCTTNPELKCTTKADCKPKQGCYKVEEYFVCMCALGFEGDDCMDPTADQRCPFPSDIIDVCEQANFDKCFGNDECPTRHICCPSPDACSSTCLPIGCDNAEELKTCTDQNKLCINDDSTDGFSCLCPLGYGGSMCETAISDFDEKCEFPEVTGDTCVEFEDPPTCTKNEDCEDSKICCSTGCGTKCVDPDSPTRAPLNPLLIALALSNRGRQSPIVPAPRAPYCPSNLCSQLVCPKNVGARCQPIWGRCDIHFYDQYTNQLITQYCQCDRGVQEYRTCFANSCSDIYGRPLVCHGNPHAKCRVTRCGSCMAYWIDERTGQRVQCA